MSASDLLTISREVVESLPLYYRAMAEYLAETGRAVIKESSEKPDEKVIS